MLYQFFEPFVEALLIVVRLYFASGFLELVELGLVVHDGCLARAALSAST